MIDYLRDWVGNRVQSWDTPATTTFAVLSLLPSMAIADDRSNPDLLLFVGILVFLLAAYLLPWIVGRRRGVNASGALFCINLLFGWTFIGWIICMMWAVCGHTRAQDLYFRRMAEQAK